MAIRHDERRLVTVLFADIVGFTGLSEARDPEQVKNLVDRCFALLADDITAFGGRVDKVIGDAIVALFGAPIAHEDDAERAVRAALRMQDTVDHFDSDTGIGIQVRIGVNTGEVLVGAISAGDDYTAMGDVVNTASRLQTSADPGWVLVGADTHAATAETIHYRSVGLLHARGREEPLEAYRALEPVGVPGERRSGPATPLIGREPELELLSTSIAAAFGRGRAQLVTLTGESGVGKTRLAQEAVEFARERHDAVVLHGRCLPYGEANVWWPIAEAIRGVIGIEAQAEAAETDPLVLAAVVSALGPEAEEANIARTVEGLHHLFGYDTGLSGVEGERAEEEGTRAARALAYGLTRRSPVLLWLSDLDWADDAVLRLLDDLLDRLGRSPLVVMVTGQSDIVDRWRPRPGRFNSLTLSIEPLANVDGDRLARELLPDVDDTVRRELVERSGGNPLFLEEMARMVASADGPEVGPLPANVRSVISSRLDALEDPALHVIEDASVLGLRGDREALSQMAEVQRDNADIAEPLRQLERVDLIEIHGRTWSFRSNLVREVVYSRLTKTDRAWRHSGIAAWLSNHKAAGNVDTIAYHHRRAATMAAELGGIAGLPDDLVENAVRSTIEAARAVSGSAALVRAEFLYGEALDLMVPGDPRRLQLLADRAASALGRLDTASARVDLDMLAPLLAGTDDQHLVVRHSLLESELAQWSGEHEQALVLADRGLELAVALGDGKLQGDALRQSGMVQLFRGIHEKAESSINAAFDAYAAVDDVGGMAWARQNLAWISYIEGRMGEAEHRLTEALEVFDRIGDPSGVTWSRGLLAYVCIHDGRFAEAEEIARKTLAESRDRGDKWGQGMMHVALANAALWTGRIDEAVTRATKATTTFPFGSDPIGPTQATAVLGRALVRSGRPTEGFRVLDAAIEAGDETMREMLESSRAAAAATVGDLAQGRRFSDHDVTTFDPDRIGESDMAVAISLIHLQMGDIVVAARLFDVMPEVDESSGSPWAWAVLALIASATDQPSDPYVALVEGSSRTTYADHVIVRCAAACAAARVSDESASRLALDRAYEAIPLGGDRIHPTVVALAEAQCLVALQTDDAAAAEVRAIKAAGAIGIDTTGWRTAFAAACGDLETAR